MITYKRRINAHIIAYNVHPSDQTSVLSSILAWLGQSHNSGARKGAEQCSAAHSYIGRQINGNQQVRKSMQMTEIKLCSSIFEKTIESQKAI